MLCCVLLREPRSFCCHVATQKSWAGVKSKFHTLPCMARPPILQHHRPVGRLLSRRDWPRPAWPARPAARCAPASPAVCGAPPCPRRRGRGRGRARGRVARGRAPAAAAAFWWLTLCRTLTPGRRIPLLQELRDLERRPPLLARPEPPETQAFQPPSPLVLNSARLVQLGAHPAPPPNTTASCWMMKKAFPFVCERRKTQHVPTSLLRSLRGCV